MRTLRSMCVYLVAGMAATAPAQSARLDPRMPEGAVVLAQSDCYAVGEQVAAQYGGTLARARSSSRDGQPVCVIVVLVPGKDGQQPRRTEVVVPQG